MKTEHRPYFNGGPGTWIGRLAVSDDGLWLAPLWCLEQIITDWQTGEENMICSRHRELTRIW